MCPRRGLPAEKGQVFLMIYLIAGCPFSGKTTLARELAHHTKIPCISTDDLSILFSYYTDFSIFDRGDYYKYYETSSSEKIRQDHLRYQTEMGKMLIHFLKTKIDQDEDIIIEGFAFSPNITSMLPQEQTRFICLVMSETLLRQRYHTSIHLSRKRADRIDFDKKYLEKLFWINNSNHVECKKLQLPEIMVQDDRSLLLPALELLQLL